MRRLLNNSEQNMTAEMLNEYITPYQAVCVDIGTGDGKRLYRVAKMNPQKLYIGIDPVRENMLEIGHKISKKPEKGGLKNLLLVIGAVETLPHELTGISDDITVYFPWGSLLECVVKPIPESMLQIRRIAKDGASFTIVTTYQTSYEAHEIEKRQLPELSLAYFQTAHAKALKALGFITDSVTELNADEVKALGTQWAKRLGSGRQRHYFKIQGHIHSL